MAPASRQRCTRNELRTDGRNRPGLRRHAPIRERMTARRWRFGAQSLRRVARAVSREAPAAAAAAAPAGPRARTARVRGDGRAVAPARRDRAPGSGQGRASPAVRDWVGWGWETNAMRLRMQRIWHRLPAAISGWEKASGDLGKPLSPDLQPRQVGSCVVALPRLCIRPPGHFVVTGLTGRRARCITCFAASLSIFGATPAHPCCRV